MLLLMHFRFHLITSQPSYLSLFNITSRLFRVHTPPIEQPQHNPETEAEKFVTHRSPPLQNAIKTISAPRTRKTGTHTYKKPGAGRDRKEKK